MEAGNGRISAGYLEKLEVKEYKESKKETQK